MARIYIKPAIAGHIIRHPEKLAYIIPEEGDYVEHTTQWERYLRHGDIVLAEPPSSPLPEKPVNKKLSNTEGDK